MISQVVDRYEVLREVGRGGMGLVYEVKDQRGYQRTYALKVMNPNVAAREDLVSRFLDEAKLLGELNDPNIVFAYDFWNTDDHTYLLMEFVQGGTLKELIQEKEGLAWQEALPIFEQVVSALSAAHEKNIIHRDIKP
ncbi:MAG: serine/threonine protein kinase, partial [Rhodothermales bacterium]